MNVQKRFYLFHSLHNDANDAFLAACPAAWKQIHPIPSQGHVIQRPQQRPQGTIVMRIYVQIIQRSSVQN